jgi:hypothetical protein
VPFQNRVTPLGELIADPARGLVYGNRGCLHDAAGRIRRRYAGRRWIAAPVGGHRRGRLQRCTTAADARPRRNTRSVPWTSGLVFLE